MFDNHSISANPKAIRRSLAVAIQFYNHRIIKKVHNKLYIRRNYINTYLFGNR
ncbi:hypothetical protein IX339_000836 [Porphyromonas levii]|nr:hypothetical protein [Porphyromonas levii]MBR8802568.1 hypothetical protein [Porphyromonas levii]